MQEVKEAAWLANGQKPTEKKAFLNRLFYNPCDLQVLEKPWLFLIPRHICPRARASRVVMCGTINENCDIRMEVKLPHSCCSGKWEAWLERRTKMS